MDVCRDVIGEAEWEPLLNPTNNGERPHADEAAQALSDIPDLHDWLNENYFQDLRLDQGGRFSEGFSPPAYTEPHEPDPCWRSAPSTHQPGISAQSAIIAILSSQMRDMQTLYVALCFLDSKSLTDSSRLVENRR